MAKKKPEKYTHITDSLPAYSLEEHDPERWQLIEAVKAKIIEPSKPDDPNDDPAEIIDMIEVLCNRLYDIELRASAGRGSAGEYARVYDEIRRGTQAIESAVSSLDLLQETYETLMAQRFQDEGIERLILKNGQPVSVRVEVYPTVKDKEAHRQWAIREGLEREMVLPWQTTKSLATKRLQAGEPEPDGVKLFSKFKASYK